MGSGAFYQLPNIRVRSLEHHSKFIVVDVELVECVSRLAAAVVSVAAVVCGSTTVAAASSKSS